MTIDNAPLESERGLQLKPSELAAAALSAALLVATLVFLRVAGRVWWCACRTPTPFSADPASSHNSQHFADWYSFSHLLHGLIFFGALWFFRARLTLAWRLAIAVAVEAAWEMLENSPIIIERYRAATAAQGYSGDSIVNSLGDILACVLGFFLARALGLRLSLVLFVAVELVMLYLIRDNLTLNVVMLVWPIDAVRAWQGDLISGG